MKITPTSQIDTVKKTVQNVDNKTTIVASNGKTLELPDIRSSQILLPDNTIYVPTAIVLPKGAQPKDFNAAGMTVEVPEYYKPAKGQDKIKKGISESYPAYNVEVYDDTKKNEKVIRLSKNVYSEKGVLDSVEIMEIPFDDRTISRKYIKDFENNTETEIVQTNPLKRRESCMLSKTTIYKDDEGKVVKTEECKKSPYLRGVFDITETDADGNKTVVSETVKREDGSIVMERNLVSLDGTKTVYRYETNADETHKKMYCQITDKDGKVLSTIDRTYDKKENYTSSSINGNEYKIEKTPTGILITDYAKDKQTPIDEKRFAVSEKTKEFMDGLSSKRTFTDENVVGTLFDTMPADTLLTMNETIKEVLPLDDDLDSAFMGVFDYLMCKTDNFVINHELGHSKDSARVADDENLLYVKPKNVIADQTEFREAYIEEKAAFVKAFPDFEEKFISYFINSPKTKPQRGRKETVAETNAINGIQPQEPEALAIRTITLQRYFPKTIALLTNIMNPIAVSQ